MTEIPSTSLAWQDFNADAVLLAEGKEDCRRNIRTDFPDEDPEPSDIIQWDNTLVTFARHRKCNVCGSRLMSFIHAERGYHIKCLQCPAKWPSGSIHFLESAYPKLLQLLTLLTQHTESTRPTLIPLDFSSDRIISFPDDPELNALFIDSLKGTVALVTPFATRYFRDRFHCTANNDWYVYDDKRGWIDDAAKLRYREELSSDVFLNPYRKAAVFFETYPNPTEEVKRKARLTRKVAMDLEDVYFRDKVVQESSSLFRLLS